MAVLVERWRIIRSEGYEVKVRGRSSAQHDCASSQGQQRPVSEANCDLRCVVGEREA